MKILLDSDVVINILKKKEETIEKLKSFHNATFYISPIVTAEVYSGAKEKEVNIINELFSFFEKIEINHEIGLITAEYVKKYKKAYCGISLEDFMIASCAKFYNLKLWTYNKKHYPMKDIELIQA